MCDPAAGHVGKYAVSCRSSASKDGKGAPGRDEGARSQVGRDGQAEVKWRDISWETVSRDIWARAVSSRRPGGFERKKD